MSAVCIHLNSLQDRTFEFVLKTPPASKLILAAAGVKKGSGNPQKIIGSITEAQLREIATTKLPDLNATTVEAAMKVVHGTCRNMGIDVENESMEWQHRAAKA
jgi:large subunit ribosomal protein L11